MRSSTSHRVFILKALRAGDEITPEDAVRRWNCWRPGARVYELRRMGIPIIDLNKNTKVRFARYFLKPEDRELPPNSCCERSEKASRGITRDSGKGHIITNHNRLLRVIRLHWGNGKTLEQAGKEIGITAMAISRFAKRYNLPLRHPGPRGQFELIDPQAQYEIWEERIASKEKDNGAT